MKNLFLCIALGLIFSNSFCQTNPSIYSQGVCECMDHSGGVQKSMVECFGQSIERNKVFFDKTVIDRGDTSESSITRLFDELLFNTQIDLIRTCKSFYQYTDSLDRLRDKNLNKDSLQKVLLQLNGLDASKKDQTYYMVKGNLFSQLGDYVNALKIADSLISNEPNNEVGLVLKALVFDKIGDYKRSAQLYETLIETTKKNGYRLFAALAKRRDAEAK